MTTHDYESSSPEMSSLHPDEQASMSNGTGPPAPTEIGPYRILAELDKGGQARTYRAFHPRLKKTVVLKLAHLPAGPGTADRIAMEGQMLSALPSHPNLVKVHDAGLHEGREFLILEDVPGSTLEAYARDRTPDEAWSAKTLATIARAVHFANDHGVTHQDLNPRNVLIDSEGSPRVIDFGVAWHRPWWLEPGSPSTIGGTPHYLAPEQAWGQADRIGRATDVFGLGGILYFLLTGKPLYPDDNLHAVLQSAREGKFDRSALDRPDIPPRLRSICLKALASSPTDRYTSLAELAAALEQSVAPSRWRRPALIAVLFLPAFALGWGLQTYAQRQRPIVARPDRPALEVGIWRPDTEFLPLLKALPIKSGDWIQLRCGARKGEGVSVYFVNPAGSLQLLKHFPPIDTDRDVFYPESGKAQKMEGASGTELLLVFVGSHLPAAEFLQRSWNESEPGPLPMLPPGVVVRVNRTAVAFEAERSRDLGEIRDMTHPQEKIRRRLDALRKKLEPSSSNFEGVAFARE